MSRIHIKFKLKSHSENHAVYMVITPDFSESGITDETIGELSIDALRKDFSYVSSDNLKKIFCPPEFFEECAGDTEKVNRECEKKGWRHTAWSYFIYKKAKQLIESKVFDEETNTGI